MTTTVHISVSGNEHVLVEKIGADGKALEQHRIAPPSGGITLGLHGKELVSVCEERAVKPLGDDFDLPGKSCDIGRPEGCESCQ